MSNKLNVMRRIIDVVEYIEQEQNSPDFQTYKNILLKVVSSISNSMSVGVANTTQQQNNPEPSYTGKLPENFDKSNCQVFKSSGGDDCECCSPNQSVDIPHGSMEEGFIPKVNIQDTIEKIKKEIENGSKG